VTRLRHALLLSADIHKAPNDIDCKNATAVSSMAVVERDCADD